MPPTVSWSFAFVSVSRRSAFSLARSATFLSVMSTQLATAYLAPALPDTEVMLTSTQSGEPFFLRKQYSFFAVSPDCTIR
ncbi:MAG: hypothetical protein BWY99_02736 [Synergistetes bacterium ADurb.BinA166]|nr:MAG: hypothetical protein BWY99_02736 [Synergistetes bacterium ADurb.BinA166]